jgi:biopolymer transport protein ExbD
MWQVHAAFRLGEYKTREIDLTPMIGVSSVMAVFLLILQNS